MEKKIHIELPRDVRRTAETIHSSGRKAFLVGGALRDHFMRRTQKGDYDLATDASPKEIMALFPRVIPTGIKHGTVTVLTPQHSVEVTTFRVEQGYSDGRRPDEVEFVSDILEDLSRRDFTMNAMAWEVVTGLLEDPFDGRADIRAHLVRSVGDAASRFSEDGLRPLRAVRFAAQLDFTIDPATFDAMIGALSTFRQVSAERVRDEFMKILLSGHPSRGLSLLEKSGLLGEILPEILPARGCSQKGMHAFDVMDHLFLAVEASKPDLALRLAALFHDIGKPAAKEDHPDGIPSFHNHERISSDMAQAALRRLKFPNDIMEKVLHLVRQHMFNYTPDWSDAAVRRFLARVGPASVEDLFDLRIADAAATAGTRPDPRPLDPFRSRIEAVLSSRDALGLKDLAIGGNDLAELGIPRGPVMGRILQALLETVLDDPSQNERETLLRIASHIKGKFGVD